MLASGALVVDACRHTVRRSGAVVPLATRPVLFALARTLGEAWPGDVARETLVARAFRGRRRTNRTARGSESRSGGSAPRCGRSPTIRGDPARLRARAARRGRRSWCWRRRSTARMPTCWRSSPTARSWSSSALAMALGASPRTVQRALDALAGGRQGAVLRPRPRPPLGDAAGAGIPDSLVTPRPAAGRLGYRA